MEGGPKGGAVQRSLMSDVAGRVMRVFMLSFLACAAFVAVLVVAVARMHGVIGVIHLRS